MYVVEKVKIVDIEEFAKKIVEGLPRLNEYPDSDGEIYDSADIEVNINGMDVAGTYRIEGRVRIWLHGDYNRQTEYKTSVESWVENLTYWINGEEVIVDDNIHIEDAVNDLLR